ncbi:MAG: hypothetical protein V1926_00675 [Candidatus Peregrinibacteria bacterium]
MIHRVHVFLPSIDEFRIHLEWRLPRPTPQRLRVRGRSIHLSYGGTIA